MTDLLTVLPDLPTADFSSILPALERSSVTTSDLLTLEGFEIAKQAQIPIRLVQKLADTCLNALHSHFQSDHARDNAAEAEVRSGRGILRCTGRDLVDRWKSISTLDEGLDEALGGGFPLGCLSEITGESGAGKTQLLLTLLLAVQLPAQDGQSKSAIYLSTESALQTSRLTQIADNHPRLASIPVKERPSLSRVFSIQIPDLESQDHILRYQLPVAIKRHDVGLVVIDSITANFRAEYERRDVGRAGPEAMAKRSAQLMETAAMLRELARKEDIAVVVANQVADRFPSGAAVARPSASQGQSLSQRSRVADGGWESPAPEDEEPQIAESLTLDHQQQWFTGWGDTPSSSSSSDGRMKTPSLGLVWTNQIACRVALRRQRRGGERRLKVVFAPWARDAAGEHGLKFMIGEHGLWTEPRRDESL